MTTREHEARTATKGRVVVPNIGSVVLYNRWCNLVFAICIAVGSA